MRKYLAPVILLVILGVGVFFALSSRTKNPQPASQLTPPARHEVIVGKDGFSPQVITIGKGDSVSFLNQSGENVTVNSDPHPTHNLYRFLNKGEFPSGTSVQVIFNEAGTFSYHNHLNPSQRGTVVVK